MEIYQGHIDDRDIEIIYDGEYSPCSLKIYWPALDMILIDDVLQNPKIASALLRDTIGYGNAVDFLELVAVPRNSNLWDLNHSGKN